MKNGVTQRLEESTDVIRDRAILKMLLPEFKGDMKVGASIAFILILFAISGQGGRYAEDDLFSHVTNINSIYYILPTLTLTLFLVFQGTPGHKEIGNLANGILKFHAHLFSVAFGSLLLLGPFWVFQHRPQPSCGSTIMWTLRITEIFVMAVLSHLGLLIVHNFQRAGLLSKRKWSIALFALVLLIWLINQAIHNPITPEKQLENVQINFKSFCN